MILEAVVEGTLKYFEAPLSPGSRDSAHAAGAELYFQILRAFNQIGEEFSPDYLDLCLPSFLDELAINAADSLIQKWRYNPEHVAKIEITLEYNLEKLKISVGDNGVGLCEDVKKEILAGRSYSTKDVDWFIGGYAQGLIGIKRYFKGNNKNWGFVEKDEGVIFWYELLVDQAEDVK